MTLTNIRIDLGDGAAVDMLYRPGTLDRPTIAQIWTKHPYGLAKHRSVVRRAFIDEEYRRIIDAGETPLIVDAGANIGASVLFFRWRYPDAKIIAIEPEGGNFAVLQRNVGSSPSVTLLQAALASHDGSLRLRDSGRGSDAFRVGRDVADDGSDLGEVRAVSMGSLISGVTATPLLAKIDIEGSEADVFARNTDWVDAFPAIAIELHDWMLPGQASSASFLACVAAKGRDFINPENSDTVFSLRN
jgi:FkbM family methyltransferase